MLVLPPLHAQLVGAVEIFGGIRRAAEVAGLDRSNLAKFLRQGDGLSRSSFQKLEEALGRPDGRVDPKRVLVLRPKRVSKELAAALCWYLPDGGEVSRATWSGMLWERIRKMLTLDLAPEVYAIRRLPDERLLVLLPAGLMLPRDLFGSACPLLQWRSGEPERAELQFEDAGPWISGNVDTETFDRAWPGGYFDPTLDDVIKEIRRLRLSYAEVIRRMNHNK